MNDPARKLTFTFAEYLAKERVSETKHEFLQGEICDMAGGTIEHARLASNLAALLHSQLSVRSWKRLLRIDVNAAVGLGDAQKRRAGEGEREREGVGAGTGAGVGVGVGFRSITTFRPWRLGVLAVPSEAAGVGVGWEREGVGAGVGFRSITTFRSWRLGVLAVPSEAAEVGVGWEREGVGAGVGFRSITTFRSWRLGGSFRGCRSRSRLGKGRGRSRSRFPINHDLPVLASWRLGGSII